MIDDLNNLIGKKVVGIYGHVRDNRSKLAKDASYILFDDGETVLELEEQDYYSYHDCSGSARILTVRKDPVHWKNVKDETGTIRKVK